MERRMPEVEGVGHRFVSADGLRMHVAEAGQGPPLMLLHGWPQHWWMWRELIGEELAAYLDQFHEPARVEASSRLYRHSFFRLLPAALRGRYRA